MSALSFSNTVLSSELTENLTRLGYLEMTPIQERALPKILAGQDIIGQGKTGSGKTATFSLGLLHNLNVKRFRVQSLVLCPTRELADQVAKEIRKLAAAIHNVKVLTLCGGTPMGPQIGSLEHGAHIIVGTPGRIEDHLRKGRLDLSELNTLVLDEADRMLEMGFQPALELIFSHCPTERQSLLFSATFPDKIQAMANQIMQKPELIKVESSHNHSSIEQHFFEVDNNDGRTTAVALLLQQFQPNSCVVFCNTKLETQALSDSLIQRGFSCAALHGDLEQRDRDQTLIRFANKSVNILVATDVAARGLDIDNITMVLNYHIAHDPEIHVHRIGRTGRAGNTGIACSLMSNKEAHKVIRLEEYLALEIHAKPLPNNDVLNNPISMAPMTTIQIDGGKKQKLRPGDILGALTANNAIDGDTIGKIQMTPLKAYVAVKRTVAKKALKVISEGKMKGRNFRARIIK
ncbi:ATP-dependent RNA helicase DbpA [Thalassotalea sp. 1_MG-2023]|uniref:ATP-dependent RNA helicase DbpA n=1 Tax=Thalassotalea sp. 1_MG-2023 TaxID=3062680 RepID=UPI0026E273AD|nr:ATP-dependent RNA helicase DbpA [Thalassotalea sp. 1_MG-2023]MDO6428262.1 ATP-dependent RNA helicase DbpA [Thalassotalea sp. 1_MG-2023]